MSHLTEEELNERRTVAELVDLILAGHFGINDTIHNSVRKIYRLIGAEGRRRLNELPDFPAYATDSDIATLQNSILNILATAEALAKARDQARAAELEKNQLKFFD